MLWLRCSTATPVIIKSSGYSFNFFCPFVIGEWFLMCFGAYTMHLQALIILNMWLCLFHQHKNTRTNMMRLKLVAAASCFAVEFLGPRTSLMQQSCLHSRRQTMPRRQRQRLSSSSLCSPRFVGSFFFYAVVPWMEVIIWSKGGKVTHAEKILDVASLVGFRSPDWRRD